MASTLPLGKDSKRRTRVGIRSEERSQWNTALLNSRFVSPSTLNVARSPAVKSTASWSENAVLAFSNMSGELSIPVMRAEGKASRRTFVLFPGPQPRS